MKDATKIKLETRWWEAEQPAGLARKTAGRAAATDLAKTQKAMGRPLQAATAAVAALKARLAETEAALGRLEAGGLGRDEAGALRRRLDAARMAARLAVESSRERMGAGAAPALDGAIRPLDALDADLRALAARPGPAGRRPLRQGLGQAADPAAGA